MLTTQEFVITDSGGRTGRVEFRSEHRMFNYLRGSGLPIDPSSTPQWRALTLGAFGAQSGTANLRLSGNAQGTRIYDLVLLAIISGGRNTPLLILKNCIATRNCFHSGGGTLFHGVNLGLQSGEITWSETSHHRIGNALIYGDVDVHN